MSSEFTVLGPKCWAVMAPQQSGCVVCNPPIKITFGGSPVDLMRY